MGKWNSETTLKFIQEYKAHECLWDFESATYKDKNMLISRAKDKVVDDKELVDVIQCVTVKSFINMTDEKKKEFIENTKADELLSQVIKHHLEGWQNKRLKEPLNKKKWDELTTALNAIGDGPHLSPEEWKKRFTDWKYSVRTKYRKIIEHMKKTGSGPECAIKLSILEERALGVWGKVVVTVVLLVNHRNRNLEVEFLVIGEQEEPILGLDTCLKLELLSKVDHIGNNNLNICQIIQRPTNDELEINDEEKREITASERDIGVGIEQGPHNVIDNNLKPEIRYSTRA
ncbi:Myb/SANT-like DNA-binding domain [Popillia japonica]|uniref:Regulatory protein zeste n=1 Tax=Popillia japonica TaxID=7064 RepID=A0AAW1JHX8_POPJA